MHMYNKCKNAIRLKLKTDTKATSMFLASLLSEEK